MVWGQKSKNSQKHIKINKNWKLIYIFIVNIIFCQLIKKILIGCIWLLSNTCAVDWAINSYFKSLDGLLFAKHIEMQWLTGWSPQMPIQHVKGK